VWHCSMGTYVGCYNSALPESSLTAGRLPKSTLDSHFRGYQSKAARFWTAWSLLSLLPLSPARENRLALRLRPSRKTSSTPTAPARRASRAHSSKTLARHGILGARNLFRPGRGRTDRRRAGAALFRLRLQLRRDRVVAERRRRRAAQSEVRAPVGFRRWRSGEAASRPCESWSQHTGGTPVPLPSEHQTPCQGFFRTSTFAFRARLTSSQYGGV